MQDHPAGPAWLDVCNSDSQLMELYRSQIGSSHGHNLPLNLFQSLCAMQQSLKAEKSTISLYRNMLNHSMMHKRSSETISG